MKNFLFTSAVNHERSQGLDAIRFILALWVLLAHGFGWAAHLGHISPDSIRGSINNALLWFFQSSGETHPAVLGFIVLSGYCIHRNGFRIGTYFNLRSYAIRRLFRILPVYWLGMLIGVVLWFVGMQIDGKTVSTLTGTSSIGIGCLLVKIFGIASFIPSLFACSFEGNAPLATAIVESWLYVFYGLVAWKLLHHESLRVIYWIFGLGWLFSFIIVSIYPIYVGWWHNSSFFAFGVYWWIGASFAEKDFVPKASLLIISILLLTLSFFYPILFLVELKKIGLSIIFAYFIRWVDDNWRESKCLAWWGQSGYCIYAFHAPILIALLVLNVPFYLIISIILLVSVICHYLFELPILEYGKRLSKQYISRGF